ncbi:MAG: ClbS/DfsB family four-helix bundle protein [Caldilineaceae bacterium]
MADQRSKAQILTQMHNERQALLALLADVSPQEMQQPGVVDAWSIKDVLAHLTAWEQLFLGWYQAGVRGETPETPAPGFTWGWKSLDLLNQQIYEQHRQISLEEVAATFHASYAQLAATVETMTEAELHTPGVYAWTRKGSLAASLGANSYNHYRWAANLVKQWRRNERLRRSI